MSVTFNKASLIRKIAISCHETVMESGEIFKEELQRLLSIPERSQPGQPPGMDSGDLQRSIQTKETTKDELHPSTTVFSLMPYASILEWGGRIEFKKPDKNGKIRDPIYIEARPSWRVVRDQQIPQIIQRVRKGLSKIGRS